MRWSLQVLHSSAALLRIADMEYSGTNSFFIQVLLNKKYALPYRVVSFVLCWKHTVLNASMRPCLLSRLCLSASVLVLKLVLVIMMFCA